MDQPHLPRPDDRLAVPRSLPRSGAAPAPRPATEPAVTPDPAAAQVSLYDRVGGEAFFTDLVARFYAHVREDPVLRPLYPEEDLGPAEERLRLFLIQYWGGPSTYSERRGHPRLRMRHAPFPVGTAQIEAWLACMRAALDEVDAAPDVEAELWAYCERAAHFMRNQEG